MVQRRAHHKEVVFMTEEVLFLIRLTHISLVLIAVEFAHDLRLRPRNPNSVRHPRRSD